MTASYTKGGRGARGHGAKGPQSGTNIVDFVIMQGLNFRLHIPLTTVACVNISSGIWARSSAGYGHGAKGPQSGTNVVDFVIVQGLNFCLRIPLPTVTCVNVSSGI